MPHVLFWNRHPPSQDAMLYYEVNKTFILNDCWRRVISLLNRYHIDLDDNSTIYFVIIYDVFDIDVSWLPAICHLWCLEDRLFFIMRSTPQHCEWANLVSSHVVVKLQAYAITGRGKRTGCKTSFITWTPRLRCLCQQVISYTERERYFRVLFCCHFYHSIQFR